VLQDVLAGDEGALLDQPVQRFLVAHREAWLTPLMQAATSLGDVAVLLGLVVLAGLAWWIRTRSWRPLGLLAAAYLGTWVLSDTIKTLTHRARPPAAQAIGHWGGYAFPSGHTTKATATYGMLAALLAATTPRWGRKVAAWTAAVLLAGLVGLSRLYLGASWLTDVLGGLALGAAWLFALLTSVRTIDQLRAQPGRPATPSGDRTPRPDGADPLDPGPRVTSQRRPPWLRRSWSTGRWSKRSTTPPNTNPCACWSCWSPPSWPPDPPCCWPSWPSRRCAAATPPPWPWSS
jgi:undecaprenyl-diphosphatase